METEKSLSKIEELVKLYNETSSRKSLTVLRQAVTVAIRRNPLLKYRIESIFTNNNLSVDTL